MSDQSSALAPREQDEQAIERAGGRERLPTGYPQQRALPSIRQSDEVNQLLPAFARAQMAFPAIAKDRVAKIEGRGNYTYKYANLADVQNAVNPVLQEQKLSFMMVPTGTRLIGRLIHESGQYIEGDLPIVQADSRGGAQALGSALTYVKRYLMSSMLGLVLDDFDDDGAAASQGRPAPVAASRDPGAYTGHAPRTPPARRPPTETEIASMDEAGCEDVLRKADKLPGLRAAAFRRLISMSHFIDALEVLAERINADTGLPSEVRAKLVLVAEEKQAGSQTGGA